MAKKITGGELISMITIILVSMMAGMLGGMYIEAGAVYYPNTTIPLTVNNPYGTNLQIPAHPFDNHITFVNYSGNSIEQVLPSELMQMSGPVIYPTCVIRITHGNPNKMTETLGVNGITMQDAGQYNISIASGGCGFVQVYFT